MNYKYVKVLAKQRSHLIQEILDATLSHFPTNDESSRFSFDVSQAIETLFLTDHCVELDGPHSDAEKNYFRELGFLNSMSKTTAPTDLTVTPVKKAPVNKPSTPSTPSTPVVPITQKRRNSFRVRQSDLNELKEAGKDDNLFLDDERPQSELVPSYSSPIPTYNSSGSKIGNIFESNPIVFAIMTVCLMIFLKRVCTIAVTLDLDVLMLFIWAAFCIGLHTPRPMITGIDKNFGPPPSVPKKAKDVHGRKLLHKMSMRMSPMSQRSSRSSRLSTIADMDAEDDDDDDDSAILSDIQSPLPLYPKGAALGAHMNCWSQPMCENFYVRGPNYLKDKVKIESGDFLWPVRGVDLFLTDTPPENVGRYERCSEHMCCIPKYVTSKLSLRYSMKLILFDF